MMNTATMNRDELERRRRDVVEKMLAIRSVCRGKITEQYLKVNHNDKKEPVLRGPYYVLTWWEEGRSRSRRIRAEELERTRTELANYERLQALSREFEELTRALGNLEEGESAAEEAAKKGPEQPQETAPVRF